LTSGGLFRYHGYVSNRTNQGAGPMSQGAAAVIDLEELRRRRAARSAPKPPPPAASMRPAPMFVPVCVVWVPVWTVA
jgi:hypothetical protein